MCPCDSAYLFKRMLDSSTEQSCVVQYFGLMDKKDHHSYKTWGLESAQQLIC